MAYELEGKLLEVCTCNVLCPCWVGEDPDGGTCDGALSWHVDRGSVNGTDVSGRTLTILTHIPGNILAGNWRVVVYVDDGASDEQQQALLDVWSGEAGRPRRRPGAARRRGAGRRTRSRHVPGGRRGRAPCDGRAIEAELEPFTGATGKPTALHDTVFTTIPGSPAYAGKASSYKVAVAEHGFEIDLQGHNAISGSFRFEG